ncbi:MAG: TerB family tellurite resistance protein [Planctomycetes bacterium]|nr:TerB family tellurite resistance protein [Planctomycetota bacterium]
MSDITYERLKNNIAEESVNGAQVTVTFRCPATERIHHAIATMRPDTGVGAQVTRQAKNELLHSARRGLRNLLRGVLGGSTGSVAGSAAASAVPRAGSVTLDRTARERAVVEAFESVAAEFAWSDEQQAYIDAEEAHVLMSDFDKQLRAHPITGHWERSVTARMLAEVVMADGVIDDDEREFFEGFMTSKDTQSLDDLVKTGALSKLELGETKPDARASMMMLAYSMAMTDEKLDAAEQAILAKFAKGLGIALDREEQIRHWACVKVVETMLNECYADGKLDGAERGRIETLAANIGVNEALVAKLDVNVRKRKGIR